MFSSEGDYLSDSEVEDGADSRVPINSQEYYKKPNLKKRKRNPTEEEEKEKPQHQVKWSRDQASVP